MTASINTVSDFAIKAKGTNICSMNLMGFPSTSHKEGGFGLVASGKTIMLERAVHSPHTSW